MFSNASNFVEGVDTAFLFIFSIIGFFFIAITAVMVWFIFRYHEKKNPVATQIEGSNLLELLWTIIPVGIVLGMFFYGWEGYKPMRKAPPKGALEIKVTARMWNWAFTYPNGKRTDTLYVPQSKAVSLDLVALDVIHSLYIPAFRLKQDMVPGKKDRMWFIANTPGRYDVFCAEYCGLNHSYMLTEVVVLPDKDFAAWLGAEAPKINVATAAPGAAGKQLVQRTGCAACHSADGTKLTGPSFKGIFGHEIKVLTAGTERTITVDEAYIRKSIIEPGADIVKGFNSGLMLPYKDVLSDEDITAITDYIKTLK